ncbi:hypothetical protein LC653_39680 [Nostoc sp. CHAB 5784]|uniref:hypothetical protein n=1 Tax=Nostoc mirabile TaxID=2907820 RepID=UPI001E639241|nr:hypothetical protein [Nostoc mirabile]MCC5669770.1 hypothetical protein [Nostoc mirabile CHAB5784]
MEENFLKKASQHSQEDREKNKAYYKSRQENLSEVMRKYTQTTPLYIWASQNRQTVQLLVELFTNSFNIENNLKQYQDQAVAAYLEKYPDMFELKRQKTHKINAQKKEQAEEVIQVLKQQIQGKQKRIRNRKARKRPVVIEHTQALKLAEVALNRIQELIEGEKKWQWYSDRSLFEQIQKLRDMIKKLILQCFSKQKNFLL